MAKIHHDYLQRRILSNPWVLLVFTSILSALEIFFAIRGAIRFDFSKSQFVIYEISYIVLLVFSLAGCVYTIITIRNASKHGKDYYILRLFSLLF